MKRSKQNSTTACNSAISSTICLRILGAVVCALFLFSTIHAQGSIFRRQKAQDKDVTINTVGVQTVPKPIDTTNGSTVTLSGSKLAVNICTVAYKREEIKPEPNPFASFLGILVKIAGSISGGSVAGGGPLCGAAIILPNSLSTDAEANLIIAQLVRTQESLRKNNQAIAVTAAPAYKTALEQARDFVRCKDSNGNYICSDKGQFTVAENSLRSVIETRLGESIENTQNTEVQLSALLKIVGDRYKKNLTGKTQAEIDDETAFINAVNTKLDCFASELERVKHVRETITAARAELSKFVDALSVLDDANATVVDQNGDPDPLQYRKLLPVDRSAKITGTVSCSNFLTKQISGDVIPFTVTYQNIPVATVSAGVLFSSLGKKQIALQPFRTGTDASGVPTFKTVFAETDTTNFQTIPFSFMNFYVSGTPKMNLNFSTGIGVNPNNGKTQIEYFVGPSLGIKNLFIQAGAHFGRQQELAGGFNIGDTVPAGFPSALPIERRYVAKFGIGISYKIPLP